MREHQRHRRQRLLAAREQLHALQPLARRLGDDVDAALELVVLVEQLSPARPPPNSVVNVCLELVVDRAERLWNRSRVVFVDALDGLAGLRDRIEQVLALRGEERVARLELVELLDGHHVDRPEPLDLLLQLRRWRPRA